MACFQQYLGRTLCVYIRLFYNDLWRVGAVIGIALRASAIRNE